MRLIYGLFFVTASALSLPAIAAEQVGLETLLNEMVDRQGSAEIPSPHYICRQSSSYDRDTAGVGKEGWFANWDRSQFVRVEENAGQRIRHARSRRCRRRRSFLGHVARCAQGRQLQPFSNGTLRVYLDGKPEPAIEGPIADILSGGKLIGAPFSESVSPDTEYEHRGHNLYLPIPYQTGCKITYASEAIVDLAPRKVRPSITRSTSGPTSRTLG